MTAHYFVLLLTFSAVFRFILLVLEWNQLSTIPSGEATGLMLQSFVCGMRFDTVIVSYMIVMPMLIFYAWHRRLLSFSAARTMASIVLVLAFIAVAAIYCLDLAYFTYNGTRITMAIFQWNANAGIIISMIWQDMQYLVLLLSLIGMVVWFGFYCWKQMGKHKHTSMESMPRYIELAAGIVLVFLLVSGMRGSMFSGPIREGDATISQYQFPNQLALNPAFVLYRDMRNSVDLMEDSLALNRSKVYLGGGKLSVSPIARSVVGSDTPRRLNVVVVLMESMTANNMAYFGNSNGLTPVLDTLAKQSLFFENAYSAGIHTNNGIFTTLFSYPSFWRLRPLSAVRINEFTGFSGVLSKNGYRCSFLTTQDASFDNISLFMPYNHFDTVISQDNYSKKQIVNTFGVPDHVQFDKAIEFLDKQSAVDKPFFSCILTASNHPPIVIPREDGFAPKQARPELGVIEYADWSIGRFLAQARKTEWFVNTIFVFVADHGAKSYPSAYDVVLPFNHIPILIYCPALIKPSVYSAPAGQIDIFPTVMGILGLPYVNNTFGVDLLREQRPYIYFSADDKIACIDREYVYIFRKSESESLYRYRTGDLTDYLSALPAKADSMRMYCKANVQAAQWCITSDKTGFGTEIGTNALVH